VKTRRIKEIQAGLINFYSCGAFRYVRQPLYLGCILVYFGLAVATASLISLALFIAIAFFYDFLATYEENLLEDLFGESYRTYKQKTGKWLPKIK
jgi:protein-S-isoprenylcysteine O-methyltransferase Ste14